MVLLALAPELIDGNHSREFLSIVFRNNFSFSEIAVGGFFILSGFLISKSCHDQRRPSVFIDKRVCRIFRDLLLRRWLAHASLDQWVQSPSFAISPTFTRSLCLGCRDITSASHPAGFCRTALSLRQRRNMNDSSRIFMLSGVLAIGLVEGCKRPVCLIVTTLLCLDALAWRLSSCLACAASP